MYEMPAEAPEEIAIAAARLIVDEGMSYGEAKRKAIRHLGLSARSVLPSNDAVLAAVREHIALFCADSQAEELSALRLVARVWLGRLAAFKPMLAGAVWNGTATRHSTIHLQLFTDDAKMVDMLLLDQKIDYDMGEASGFCGKNVPALTFVHRSQTALERQQLAVLGEPAQLVLAIYAYDDLRGALKPGVDGWAERGDAHALSLRMANEALQAIAHESLLVQPEMHGVKTQSGLRP